MNLQAPAPPLRTSQWLSDQGEQRQGPAQTPLKALLGSHRWDSGCQSVSAGNRTRFLVSTRFRSVQESRLRHAELLLNQEFCHLCAVFRG